MSLVALGISLVTPWVLGGSLRTSCRGLVTHRIHTLMFHIFVVLLCVAFAVICCSHKSPGNSTYLSASSGGQSSPGAIHSNVLAHSGGSEASSLAMVRLQGSPWEIPWPTWWETWGPICYAHPCFSVSRCPLLNHPWGSLRRNMEC